VHPRLAGGGRRAAANGTIASGAAGMVPRVARAGKRAGEDV